MMNAIRKKSFLIQQENTKMIIDFLSTFQQTIDVKPIQPGDLPKTVISKSFFLRFSYEFSLDWHMALFGSIIINTRRW